MPDKTNYMLDDFFFELPESLIAQKPSAVRDQSRLFHLNRKSNTHSHHTFSELPGLLREGDVLVFNDARVRPARIFCTRETGARVEVILTEKISDTQYKIITNRTKRIKPGQILHPELDPSLAIKIVSRTGEFFDVETDVPFTDSVLSVIGKMPLPPYIKRDADSDDLSRYQTVYAKNSTAAAAPTAGLHFTNELFAHLDEKKIERVYLTLDVSWGTFQPVRSQNLEEHDMHSETFFLPKETADAVNRARRENRRVIAVGTTSLRVLESTFSDGVNSHGPGSTNIFLYPPKKVQSIDAIITNFHTPYSTLLMLVSAFAGYECILNAYKKAVEMQYRFFSYGDAMFIE